MCWSPEVSAAMVVAGAVAAVHTRSRGAPPAIWLALGYFSVMEALQVLGYAVVDQCGLAANRSVTLLSYLHIVFQPFVINAFAMELVPDPVRARARAWVFGLCGVSAAVMLAQLVPLEALGRCAAGTALCAERLCTVAGTWHISWEVPYNGLMRPIEEALGLATGFPTYMATVFLLPLAYGAWRFSVMHALAGPLAAWVLTDDPNEMPAIWCLFSIAILLIALSPWVRARVSARSWWGLAP